MNPYSGVQTSEGELKLRGLKTFSGRPGHRSPALS